MLPNKWKFCEGKSGSYVMQSSSISADSSRRQFVVQSLHKALPCTTSYYKVCTKQFSVLLCTTKLAQSTSQYYFFKNKGNHQRRNEENLLTNHYRSLDAATPIRFIVLRMQPRTKQLWRCPAAHTRCPSSPVAATLHGKTQGFVFRFPPQAITMRFAASRGKPACIYAHGNTKWQQLRSNSNAICNHKFKKRIELRTHEQPHLAEHKRKNRFDDETIAAATAAHTRYPSSPPAATLRGKTQGFVLRCSPQHKPHATFMQPLHCVL